ncbi:MAG: hypothetical protein DDT20_00208 [Firmicutes bacterium]|nr:hypothetical protein [Bacillota bacterium]
MNLTLDEVRGLLLLCAKAFSGKRGRSGITKFLMGEASFSTQHLARESGAESLFGTLSGLAYPEIQQSMTYLERSGFVEIVPVEAQGKTLPLLHVTPRGLAELERLRPALTLPLQVTASTEKMLRVLTRLARLLDGLKALQLTDLVAHMECTEGQLRQYIQLLCKVLQLRPEAVLATTQARQHFAGALERALCTAAFAELTEVEAQALRLYVGIELKHQLDRESLLHYYDLTSPEDKARQAAGRLAGREWQHKHPLVSVLGFLSL